MVEISINKPRIFYLLTCLAWLLAACQSPTPTPAAEEFPQAVVMQVTPGLRVLTPILQACAAKDPDLALFIEETPKTAIDLISQTDEPIRLGLALGEPLEQSYSAVLAEVELTIIAHPSNPVQNLTAAEITELFSGQVESWATLGGADQTVTPWVLTPADESRQLFERIFLREEPLAGQARLAADPAWMLAGVSANPGAIGYLPVGWLDKSVKTIEIESPLAEQLRLPLLALAGSEPKGAARRLLVCLQSGSGQPLLSDLFQNP